MDKLATIGIAVAFAVMALASPASASSDENGVDYVIGAGIPGVNGLTAICQNAQGSGSPGINGACAVPIDSSWSDVEIEVADDIGTNQGFRYRCAGGSLGGVSQDESGNSVTLSTNDCSDAVTVWVSVGGTTGTIFTREA